MVVTDPQDSTDLKRAISGPLALSAQEVPGQHHASGLHWQEHVPPSPRPKLLNMFSSLIPKTLGSKLFFWRRGVVGLWWVLRKMGKQRGNF